MPRCLAEYHNTRGPKYDGRLVKIRDFIGGYECKCKVCGHSYLNFYPKREELVKTEVELFWEEIELRKEVCNR